MSKTNELIQRFLGEPARNLMHAMYDDYVEANVRFRSRAGVRTFIVRRELSKCCEWCHELAGIYWSGDAPDNIYQRHDNCRCVVTFRSEKGKYVDVWSKDEFDSQKDARKARQRIIQQEQHQQRESTKILNEYLEKATPGKGSITFEHGYKSKEDEAAHIYGKILHQKFGGDLEFRNRSNNRRKSDYLWNGKFWDHKSVSSLKSADNQAHSILDQIRGKPGGMIVQCKGDALTLPLIDLEQAIRNRLNRSAANHGITEMDVFIFRGRALVLSFRWTKK